MKWTVGGSMRLDAVLASLAAVSRAQVSRAIEAGEVVVNGAVCNKPGKKVAAGDCVEWTPPENIDMEHPGPESGISFGVVYEDDDIFVINKPAGLVVHPGAGHPSHTLVNGLLAMDPGLASVGAPDRPGIVHRLDAPTSGLLVVARTARAYERLVAMFAGHEVYRQYWAIAFEMRPIPNDVIWKTPFGRHPIDRIRYSSKFDSPKIAVTHCHVLERFGRYILATCLLETGRTHQVRVHMSDHGAPLLGDTLYAPKNIAGSKYIPRLALHAQKIAFRHPISQIPLELSAPFPNDFLHALDALHFHAHQSEPLFAFDFGG